MIRKIVTRPYVATDFSACLAIFASNVPTFFALQEREGFLEHLNNVGTAALPYLVLELDSKVVACGGLTHNRTRQKVSLMWGMVDRNFHNQRLGTLLTQTRIIQARSIPGLIEIELSTSQHTYGFYLKFGFSTTKVTLSGFGPGLDRWDMILRL